MAVAAAAAAAAAAASKSVFDYNRENFMEDREQRMKKEFAERRFRIAQAELWREDVRGFVQLTEMKMSIYLVVNVLMLGFTLNLWCEGRLPEYETPLWLLMGNQLAIVGAFCFLLLTVWLAMHASVAAQSYQTRVLTQLVRLPIPSWDELEACRTYASEFEKLEPRQMFRVPFLAGSHEDVLTATLAGAGAPEAGAAPPAAAGAGSARADAGAGAGRAGAAAGATATDPWGLERRGDDTYELGCHRGADVAQLRHIRLTRQAAVYWQTYDAFARVSMSIGVNQLMLAISYYIVGYALNEVEAPAAAFAGVAILICTAEVVAQIDLTLPAVQQRIIQFLLVLGPSISCLAAYSYSQKHEWAVLFAEGLAPVAFFSHGIVIGLMAVVLRVREQENGAMIPLAFQGVLYLDVFGWVSHAVPDSVSSEGIGEGTRIAGRRSTFRADTWWSARRRAPSPSSRSPCPAQEQGAVGFYALDYLDEPPSHAKRSGARAEHAEADIEAGDGREGHTLPAVACVAYDENGRPIPTRPEEMAKQGSVHDLRLLPGAPRMWDTVNALEPPAKEFWNPVTFMPPESRRRHKMDEFLSEHAETEADPARSSMSMPFFSTGGSDEDTPIMTGHDNEMPGVLPWRIFKLAAVISSSAWILGGAYCVLQFHDIWNMHLPWWWEVEERLPSQLSVRSVGVSAVANTTKFMTVLQTGEHVVQKPGILGLWAAGLSSRSAGQAAEHIRVAWPYPTMTPLSLACDPMGRWLLATDGLSVFAAELGPAAAPQKPGHPGPSPALAPAQLPAAAAEFRRLPHCPALRGKGVEDVALVCADGGNGTGGRAACEALVLHGRGRRLAGCPLSGGLGAAGEGPAPNYASGISGAWLRRGGPRVGGSQHAEQASWLLVDPACAEVGAQAVAGRGCTSVGTTDGRVAQLRSRSGGGDAELVPVNVFGAAAAGAGGAAAPAQVGSMRALGGRYVGILQPRRRSIRVFDAGNDGAEVGTLLLPATEPVSAFCAGGGHAYLLGEGRSPRLWRFPLPEGGLPA